MGGTGQTDKGTPGLQSYGLAVLAGLASGLVLLSASRSENGALLGYLTPLPLVCVGLTQGWLRALVATAAAGLVVVAVAHDTLMVLFAYCLLGCLPAMMVVFLGLLARRDANGAITWLPPGTVLAWLTTVALLVMVIGCLTLPTHGASIATWVTTQVSDYVGQMAQGASPELLDSTVKVAGALAPALVGMSWLILALVNGMAGQWIAGSSGRSLRPAPSYLALELPRWLLVPLALGSGVSVMASGDVAYLARNVVALSLTPYAFLGLSVVHRTLAQRSSRGILVPLLYVVFFLLSGWALAVFAGIGLVKQWTGLRRKITADSQEDE